MSGAPPEARDVTSRPQPAPAPPSRQAAPPPAPPTAAQPPAPQPSARPEASKPSPSPQAQPAPAAEAPAQQAPEPVRAAGEALSLSDVRRLWPDVVEAVKTRRKVTWMQLTQHAQVVGFADGVLTVGFNNVGARESFVKGGSDTIVQQAVIELVGQEWKVEAINDPSAQAGAKPTQAPPRPGPKAPPAEESHEAHRDDQDVESIGGPELLSSRLGAQVIEEIPHD
jgi:DNA polymerase-3 subunit gamma/tau